MKYLLLFFIYCTVSLCAVTCYKIGFASENFGRAAQEQPTTEKVSVSRQRRQQNQFLPDWNSFRRNTGGFNWGGSQNDYNNAPRPSRQNDIIFEDSDYDDFVNLPITTQKPPSTTSSLARQPGMATRRSSCEDNCRITTQFDPVCGDNDVTYTNINWLKCAQRCGRNVKVKHIGSCPRVA